MNYGIKGKKALVTGSAVGIGKAIAIDLAKEGVHVVITSRNEKELKATFEQIGGSNSGHYSVVCDLINEDGPEKLYRDIHANFGEIDMVVNNIGSTLDIKDPYCSISDWRKVFRLNLEVAIEINNLCLQYMKKNNWGRIINISSTASMENNGPVTFCTAKSALTAYTRSMGRILATETENVVMSAVLPGAVVTEGGHWQNVLKNRPEDADKYLKERCPLGRFGKTDEISPMVVFLCSEAASFCQGTITPVDGGQSRHYFKSWD